MFTLLLNINKLIEITHAIHMTESKVCGKMHFNHYPGNSIGTEINDLG